MPVPEAILKTLRSASGSLSAAETTTPVNVSPGHKACVVTLNVTTITTPNANDEIDFYLQSCVDTQGTWYDLANVHLTNSDDGATAIKQIIVGEPAGSLSNVTVTSGVIADNTATTSRGLGHQFRLETKLTGTGNAYAYSADILLKP